MELWEQFSESFLQGAKERADIWITPGLPAGQHVASVAPFFSSTPPAAFLLIGQIDFPSEFSRVGNVVSEATIAFTFFVLPSLLGLIGRANDELPQRRWRLFLIGFIFACGISHSLQVWNIWQTDHGWGFAIRIVGAILAVGTICLWRKEFASIFASRAKRSTSKPEVDPCGAERTRELESAIAELRQAESNHRFLAETMPQIIWTAGPGGVVDYHSQKWFDYAGQQIKNADWGKVLHPEDGAECGIQWAKSLREGTAYEMEARLKRASDGQYRWHLVRALPQRDESGQIVRWVGTSTDIHDQKVAEQKLEDSVSERDTELAASEERFRLAFEFAGIGMAIVALDGGFIKVNRALCEIVGYKEEELLSRNFQAITHPDDLRGDLVQVRELTEGKKRSYQLEKRYLHRRGYPVWSRLTVAVVQDSQGQAMHFISQIEDITERKRLEQSLNEARDQALEASRMKSEFLATMSHEIRTPMNGIIGMSGLIMETTLTPEQQEMGSIIRRSGESLLTIINDILDFSKIEAGKMRLEPGAFVLRDLIEETASLLAAQGHEKSLEVICDVDPALGTMLHGDGGRIQQVVTNLLGNAVKFTSRGEVILRARVLRMNEISLGVRVEIQDSGIGIAPEVQHTLFQPFMQGNGSVTRRFGGTGLGLAICRQLIGLMGGEIGVVSEEGKGSTFWFELTLPRAETELPGASEKPPSDCRVLVVDDNETNRKIFLGQLGAMEVEATAVDSADSALIALSDAADAQRPYSIALIDARMPGMDGLALAAKIRATPAWKDLILVMMSSAPPEVLEKKLAGLDFAAMLTKPVRQAQLNRTLCRLLGKQEVSRPVGSALAAASQNRNRSLRLLLAEDDISNQLVGRLMLEQMGHRVEVVENGIQALDRLSSGRYDAVLLDCQMPGLDGYEVARRVRGKEFNALNVKIPIIALTAYAMPEDRARCLAAGMNDYASKPFNRDEITSCFSRCGLTLKW